MNFNKIIKKTLKNIVKKRNQIPKTMVKGITDEFQ